MDRDKQSSKHAFGAWSDPTNKIMGGSLAVHRSVILVQLPDDSSLEGNGNSNCCSRFSSSSSSSLLVLALRLTAVSSASLAQLSHAAHAATPAVRPRLSFHTSLLAGIVRFGALSNIYNSAETFRAQTEMSRKYPPFTVIFHHACHQGARHWAWVGGDHISRRSSGSVFSVERATQSGVCLECYHLRAQESVYFLVSSSRACF